MFSLSLIRFTDALASLEVCLQRIFNKMFNYKLNRYTATHLIYPSWSHQIYLVERLIPIIISADILLTGYTINLLTSLSLITSTLITTINYDHLRPHTLSTVNQQDSISNASHCEKDVRGKNEAEIDAPFEIKFCAVTPRTIWFPFHVRVGDFVPLVAVERW